MMLKCGRQYRIVSKNASRVLNSTAVSGRNRLGLYMQPLLTMAAYTRTYSSKLPSRLTAETYPEVKRDGRFKSLAKDDIDYFKSILSETELLEGNDSNDSLAAYNEDWMRKYKGQSKLLLKPKTVEQVSKIIKYCNDNRLAVVPQGGNTGLVGGSIPVFDEIILSLANLNKIREFDPVSGIFKCDAGVILEAANEYLEKNGYIFPLDLGAKGSCHVGGVVATNAGGLRLLRYGSLHGSVLGLEVVLPNGKIVNSMHSLRKDNTGYDIKQLFIGSEGTIGIITGVSILAPPKPKFTNVCFLSLEDYESVQKVFVKARQELSEIISAYEFMDNKSLSLTKDHLEGVPFPLEDEHPFYVLIETSGSNKEHDDAKLEAFLELAMEEGLVTDGVVAQDETELANLWQWREMIPESSQSNGGVYKYDVSLPLKSMYSLVEAVNDRLTQHGLLGEAPKPVVSAIGYGHIGDGNLHLNVAVREYTKEVEKCLEPFVYEFIQRHHGSVSAEHGLGFQKKNYIQYSKTPEEIEMIKSIKNQYDPNSILNPYKYI